MDLKIGRFHAHIGVFAIAITLSVAPDEGLFLRSADALEIGRGGDVMLADIRAHRLDLGLGGGEAGDRQLLGVEAEVVEGLIEEHGRLADHRREDDVRAGGPDVAHDRIELLTPGIERHIHLADHFAARLIDEGAHDAVRFARIDIVGADEIETRAVILREIGEQRQAVLVGRRSRIDDVGREFETFIKRRIPQETVEALDDRQDRLAAR